MRHDHLGTLPARREPLRVRGRTGGGHHQLEVQHGLRRPKVGRALDLAAGVGDHDYGPGVLVAEVLEGIPLVPPGRACLSVTGSHLIRQLGMGRAPNHQVDARGFEAVCGAEEDANKEATEHPVKKERERQPTVNMSSTYVARKPNVSSFSFLIFQMLCSSCSLLTQTFPMSLQGEREREESPLLISGISSDTLSGISSGILSGISCDILSGISSDIHSGILQLFLASLLTFFLAYLLTLFLTFLLAYLMEIFPAFYLAYLLTFCMAYLLTFFLAYLPFFPTFYLAYLLHIFRVF